MCLLKTMLPIFRKGAPSLEAYGIEVYITAIVTFLKYIIGKDTVAYFGLVPMKLDDVCT